MTKKYFILGTVFVGCFVLAEPLKETIITWEKPYGCTVTVKGTPFYVSAKQKDLAALPVELFFPANENIRQTRITVIASGEYAAYVTFKRLTLSEKKLHRFHIVANQVNQPVFALPAWCNVNEKVRAMTEKTKQLGSQVGEKAKTFGGQAGEKAKHLFQQLKKELKP